MDNAHSLSSSSRRRFLRQSFAFSAAAALAPLRLSAFSLPASREAAELLMIDDWGYMDDHQPQKRVSLSMQAYLREQKIHPEALVLLGDNWYGALDGGADSPRWQTQFESMYPADVFHCPAYAILGNHDYQIMPASKVNAELEYARRGKTRWTMPARWYRFEFPAQNPLITFLALDSNVPFPDGAATHGPNFSLTAAEHAAQLSWLEQELQKPRTTPFLVVLGHHPVYSDGPHGDYAILIRDWDPLFRKYGVHAYLGGHDHDLQHLEFEGHPTSFFLSGGGGADLYDLKVAASVRGPYAQKVYGFSHLTVTPQELTLRHIDQEQHVLHAFSKTRDGKLTIYS